MDPVSVIGLAASVAQLIDVTSTAIKYLNEVKNAPKDRAKVAREATGLLSLLTDLRYRIEDVETMDPWFQGLLSLGGKGGPLDVFKGDMEELASRLNPTRSLHKLSIFWPFEKKAVDTILSKIERLKSLIGLALQKDHFQLSLTMKEDVIQGFERLSLSQDAANIIAWLAAPDPSLNHESARKKRQPKTGDWFLSSKDFLDWTSNAPSLFWLHGMPGCGKTILCSTIIQSVTDSHALKPNVFVLYYYFDFKDASKQNTQSFIRSLIAQLTAHCPQILKSLLLAYKGSQNGRNHPRLEEMKSILFDTLKILQKVYIVVDALDECIDRAEVLGFIEELWTLRLNQVHILATSRREMDIVDALLPHVTYQMSLENRFVDADIIIHVKERVSNDSKLRRWPTEIREEIEEKLIEGAKGMFRWVDCQLEFLRKCLKLDALRTALRSLPKTLEATYQRIICNIEEEYQGDAMKVLQWVCFSIRPMSLAEMVEVLATDLEGEPSFKPDQRLLDPSSILSICSSLISLFPPVTGDETQNAVVGLAHYSVKEFLVSSRANSTNLHSFKITQDASNISIAQTCLTYLQHFETELYNAPRKMCDFPLFRYAAMYWISHYRDIDMNVKQGTLTPFVLRLIGSRPHSIHWREFYRNNGISRESSSLDLSSLSAFQYLPFQLASALGLEEIVELMLNQGTSINERDEKGSALHKATLEHHDGVVRLLLSRGADVHALDRISNTPLIIACGERRAPEDGQRIVQSLLKAGSNCNAHNKAGRTALFEALACKWDDLIPLLLEYGADVNVQDVSGDNPLRLLAQGGPENYPTLVLVQLLLDHGAHCDKPGIDGITPLMTAASQGHYSVAKLLLSKGANVNSRSDAGHTALYRVSWYFDEAMAKLLIENGANCNIPDINGFTPLMVASKGSDPSFVKILLEGGADAHIVANKQTALDMARAHNVEGIVKILEAYLSGQEVPGPSPPCQTSDQVI